MMKKILSVVFTSCILLITLLACTPEDSGEGGNHSSGVIFDKSTSLTVVYEEDLEAYTIANKICNEISGRVRVELARASAAEVEHEIVVGKTEREVSVKAYEQLERIDVKNATESRFLIYSDGSSVAIAYDVDEYSTGAAGTSVVNHFINNYLIGKGSLVAEEGVLDRGIVDIVEFQEKIDEQDIAQKWVELEGAIAEDYAEEITSALKSLYAVYSDDVVSWFANLYEPYICICSGECQKTQYCGGGGYYYSNSARNTEGYLPDAESTRQALNFISGSGLADSFGGYYMDFVPDWMREQIIKFIKGLQDSGGYFYHPQWGKELTDTSLSRRARDLKWCTKILEDFGVNPTYNTPNGMKGDGVLADGTPVAYHSITSPLDSSVVIAVSKVVNVASSSYVAPHLKDDVSFKNYLSSLPIETESYEVGNELSSQVGEILARDEVLKDQGYSLAEIAIEWLNSKQNPKTGTWDEKYDYHATNGLMKISCFYDDVGAEFPNAQVAVQSALYSMTTDEDPYNVCCVYNNWFTINNIISNLRRHGGADAEKKVAEVRALLYEQGAASVIATAKKLSLFKKIDGSFSYKQEYSSFTSQSMPVCVPYTNEGDVNATDICIEGTLNNLFASFGLSKYKIPVLSKADAIEYLTILDKLAPVIKDDSSYTADYVTFDDDIVGGAPFDITADLKSEGAYATVIEDPRQGVSGNVLQFNSPSGKQNILTIGNMSSGYSSNCYVFESDICVESADDGYIIQLNMGRCYMLAFRISGGKLNIWDSSNTSSTARVETELGIAPDIGEWFNIKIEYYTGDNDTVRIIAYYNGNPVAVSNNYYDNSGTKIDTGTGTPSSSYNECKIYTISSRSCVVLFDNMACYKMTKSYEIINSGDLYQNVDNVSDTEVVYDFEESEHESDYPESLTVSGDGALILTGEDDKSLLLKSNISTSVNLPITVRKSIAKCNLVEFDLLIQNANVGAYLDLILRENNTNQKPVIAFRIEVADIEGEEYGRVVAIPDGNVTEILNAAKISLNGENHIALEYFEKEHITFIYINDVLVAASKELSAYGKQYIPGKLELLTKSTVAGEFVIDNLKAEKNTKSFDEATRPSGDSVIYDFETERDDVVLNGGAEITQLGGQNVVSLIAGSDLTLPINVRGVVNNCISVTADIVMLTSGSSGVYRLAILDESGNYIFALGVQRRGNTVQIIECSESGMLTPVISTFYIGTVSALNIEIYPEEDVVNIFLNGQCIGVSSVFYSDGASELLPGELKVTGVSGDSPLAVDNVCFESLYKVYDKMSVAFDDADRDSETLTFGNSMTGLLPSCVTPLYQTDASIRVKEMIVDTVRSKVLTFGTKAGGNDAISFAVTKNTESYNAVIFESDIYLDFISCTSGKPQYHIFFETESATAYQFRIVKEDDNIVLRDHDNTTQGANVVIDAGANEWFKLRIELYFVSSTEFKVLCYVDDTLAFESDHYYGKGEGKELKTAVDSVRFYTMSAMTADISFDNLSFKQEVKVYEAPEEEKAEVSAEILPVKGGADGIVVLMHDDGDLLSASLLDAIYKKYSLRGNVALIAERVWDVENGSPIQSTVNSWQALFDTGRWNLSSHSLTHDWWGTDDSDGKITEEVVSSQTILKNLFPNQRVATFVYPGFSDYEDTYTTDEIYGIAKELVDEYYVSGRYFGNSGAFNIDGADWSFVIAESIGQDYLNTTLSTIDEAAGGKMAVIFMHNVCQDTDSVPSNTVTYSHMESIAKRIAQYVNDGSVWNAFYEDAVLYVREAADAKLEFTSTDSEISVTLTDTLPDEIYDYPLSVRITLSESYEAVKVVQGNIVSYAVCKNVDGKWVADVDVIPNGVSAVITSCALTDVPADSDENDKETVSGVVDFESSAVGSQTAISSDASVSVSGSTVENFDKGVVADPVNEDKKAFGAIASGIKSNSHVYIDRAILDGETGNYYIFKTKLYLDAYKDGDFLPASTSFATLDFRIQGTSNAFYTVNLRRIRTDKDTENESRGLILTPTADVNTYLNKNDVIPFGSWIDLTVELHIDINSLTSTAKYYVGETLILTDTQSFSEEFAASVPNRVDVKYISGTSSVTYFDDVSFVRSSTPFLYTNNEDEDKEKANIFDFESSEIGDTIASSQTNEVNLSTSSTTDPAFIAEVIESPSGDENKVFGVKNLSTSNRHVRFDFNTSIGNASGDTYTLKMKMYISSEGAIDGVNFADMDFRVISTNDILYTARMFFRVDESGNVTVYMCGNSKGDYGEFVSDIPTDEWVEFELSCYCYVDASGNNAVDSTVKVDGSVVGAHTGLNYSGSSLLGDLNCDRFNIKTYQNTYSEMYIDDVTFTRSETEEQDG